MIHSLERLHYGEQKIRRLNQSRGHMSVRSGFRTLSKISLGFAMAITATLASVSLASATVGSTATTWSTSVTNASNATITTATYGTSVTINASGTGFTTSSTSGTAAFYYSTDGGLTYTAISACTTQPVAVSTSTGTATCTTTTLPTGTTNVEVVFSGDSTYNTETGSSAFTVTQATQTISMNATDSTTYAPSPGNTFTVTASTNASADGATITYSIASTGNTAGCTVNATSGVVTYANAGTCTVYANSAATTNYAAAAQVQDVLTINQAAQATLVVATGNVNFVASTSVTLTTSGGSGTGAVSWTLIQPGSTYCSLAGDVLSASQPTNCTVVAYKAGDIDYLATTSAPSAVEFYMFTYPATPAPLNVVGTTGVAGTAITLSTTGGSGTGAITFSLVGPGSAGCSLSGNVLTATSAGTCQVIANQAADSSYQAGSSGPTTITFSAAPSSTTPPPAGPKVSHTGGFVRGHRSVVRVYGSGFYGQPHVTSNARGTIVRVAHDSGNVLTLIVFVSPNTPKGVHVFTITFANGQVVRVRYIQR